MSESLILRDVAGYYGGKARQHGASPAGVDWRDSASQNLRFQQLIQIARNTEASILDLGCGYGAMLTYMRRHGHTGRYHGLDIAPEMISMARATHTNDPSAAFTLGKKPSEPSDYAIASGIFNVRLDHENDAWRAYIESTLETLNKASIQGFAFNCLTSYADADRKRPDLYYADPGFFFDLCRRKYARNIALLHDYDLYEFTILVRKQS